MLPKIIFKALDPNASLWATIVTGEEQMNNSKDQHMRKLGPGGVTPSSDVFFQAGIGVPVQGTISLVVRPCRLHGADELIAFHGTCFFW